MSILFVFGAVNMAVAGTSTDTFAVTANVVDSCLITATDINFGDYDPVSTNATTPVTRSDVFSYTCTSGTSATVSMSEGTYTSATGSTPQRAMMNGTNALLYNLYSDAGYTNVWQTTSGTGHSVAVGTGSAQSFTVYAKIDAGQNTVPVGSYSDTVTVTITF
jgi:spore coat protein U-like protein